MNIILLKIVACLSSISNCVLNIIAVITVVAQFPRCIDLYKSTNYAQEKRAKKKAASILYSQMKKYKNGQIYISATVNQSDNPQLIVDVLGKSRFVQKRTGNLIWTTNGAPNVSIEIPVSKDYNDIWEKHFLLREISDKKLMRELNKFRRK